jgi:hypothetical protein
MASFADYYNNSGNSGRRPWTGGADPNYRPSTYQGPEQLPQRSQLGMLYEDQEPGQIIPQASMSPSQEEMDPEKDNFFREMRQQMGAGPPSSSRPGFPDPFNQYIESMWTHYKRTGNKPQLGDMQSGTGSNFVGAGNNNSIGGSSSPTNLPPRSAPSRQDYSAPPLLGGAVPFGSPMRQRRTSGTNLLPPANALSRPMMRNY